MKVEGESYRLVRWWSPRPMRGGHRQSKVYNNKLVWVAENSDFKNEMGSALGHCAELDKLAAQRKDISAIWIFDCLHCLSSLCPSLKHHHHR
jgi:hypothetical protein